MAYTTEFIDGGHGVLHIGSEIVLGSEVIDGATRVFQAAKNGAPLCFGLVDFSDITRFAATTNEIKKLARININTARIIGKASTAIIAPSDCIFGMARMWEAYVNATGWNTRVFRDANEAKNWLTENINDKVRTALDRSGQAFRPSP